LKNEEIVTVEKIKPKISVVDEDTIEVGPEIDDPDSEQFTQRFDNFEQIKKVYPIDKGGAQRKRIIIGKEVKSVLQTLKRKKRYTKHEKAQFLDDPTSFMQGFDLSDFSERVYAIGEHIFHSVPSMVKGGTAEDWGLGLKLQEGLGLEKDDENAQGTEEMPSGDDYVDTIRFANQEDLEEFKRAVEEAKQIGTCYAKHRGNYIKFDPDIIDDYLTRVEEFLDKKSQTNDLKKLALLIFSNCDYIEYSLLYTAEVLEQPDFFSYEVPVLFSKKWTLKYFQQEGYGWFRWLFGNSQNAYKGCLLADDMGLGKTIQVIALMAYLKETNQLSPSLVIVPLVLLDTWKKHLDSILEISTYIFHGHQRTLSEEDFCRYDVILITYPDGQFKIPQ